MPTAPARPLKLSAAHVDTCLSCYWGGHHVPHLQVAVWNGMTLAELKEGLHQEMLTGCFGGSDDRAQDHHPEYSAFHDAAKAAIDAIELKDGRTEDTNLFPDLEERTEDDDGEEVYAFFLFLEEESDDE